MLTPLVNWLAAQQRELEQAVLSTPPPDWAAFQRQVGEYKVLSEVLEKIDRLQKAQEQDDDHK